MDPAAVETALNTASLVPPAAPSSIGAGATAELRSSMARFSSGVDHDGRRASVDFALAAIGHVDVAAAAESTTRRLLHVRTVDVLATVGFVAPTQTLGAMLGVPSQDLDALVADVRSIVEVIGRGAPATAATDEAATRLRRRFVDHPGGPDATVSLLYQNHDATAALFASRLLAPYGSQRRGALAKTVRFVAADVDLGGERLAAGTTIELSLDDPRLEFGAGRHRCPGAELAGAMVDGMLAALDGWSIVRDGIVDDADGRPLSVPMKRTR